VIALEQAGAEDVRGQQIGRALDATEGQAERAREGAREQRLAHAGHVLDQRMAAGKQRDGEKP